MNVFLANLCLAISTASNIFNILIFIRIIFSWLRIGPNGVITRFIYNFTELILAPIRSLLSKSPFGGPGMMLDFSPFLACILVSLFSNILINIISQFAI